MNGISRTLRGSVVLAAVLAVAPALAAAALPAAPPFALPAAALAGVLLGAACGARLLRRALEPAAAASAELGRLGAALAEEAALAGVQNELDRTAALLRDALYALGDPRVEGDTLLFGDTPINDDEAIVDAIRDRAGGTATIFLRDIRISTSIRTADGRRATGTRLDAAPVLRALFDEATGYRGEAEILRVPHLTYYEPILVGAEAVGAFYVGVSRAAALSAATASAPPVAHPIDRLVAATRTIRAASEAQRTAARTAITGRMTADDARRRQDAERVLAARRRVAVLDNASGILRRIASGDLSADYAEAVEDAYRPLREDLNAAVSGLRGTVAGVRNACAGLHRDGTELGAAAEALQRRTETQAANLEQTAAALNQLTATVKASAEGAAAAGRMAGTAKRTAGNGAEAMERAVTAMERVEESSGRIGAIVATVDEIAFQTNLLALNAAVEAARAGEAGRGFAVVAAEVRSLAQRSADAARDVKTLIGTCVSEVADGVRAVRRTGQALDEIGRRITEVDRVVGEIAASATEQASGLDQINDAVTQLDRITQQNAAMAEEAAAATGRVALETAELSGLVAQFRLGGEADGGLAARPAERSGSGVDRVSPRRPVAIAAC